ncbi:hypothetical protein [Aeromonas allosaccharophila]|uniref:hypothetical protein n=1 Tax=Aeromonas allosaccharophila TaxID=656 RepID=UPI003D2606B9
MMAFFSSVMLTNLSLIELKHLVNPDCTMDKGTVSFNHELTFRVRSDISQEDMKDVGMIAIINLEGVNENNERVFHIVANYDAEFHLIDNKDFFLANTDEQSHYCFTLMYPYILSDFLNILKSAGFEGVSLPLSVHPKDMVKL